MAVDAVAAIPYVRDRKRRKHMNHQQEIETLLRSPIEPAVKPLIATEPTRPHPGEVIGAIHEAIFQDYQINPQYGSGEPFIPARVFSMVAKAVNEVYNEASK